MRFYSFISKYQLLLLSFIGGVLYACGFPMFNGSTFFLGPLIGFTLLNFALQKEAISLREQLSMALAYSLGFYLFGFYWIPHTLLEFGGLVFPFNFLLGLVFSIFIIPQIYVFTLIQRKIKNLPLLALLFVLSEEMIPQQFPAHIGHSFMSLAPILPLKLAPIFGAAAYSFITAYLSLAFVSHFRNKKVPLLSYTLVALMIIFNFFGPSSFQGKFLAKLNVRIVQPNVGNFMKVDAEKGSRNSISQILDDYFKLSTAPSPFPLDLIIWPETAFPSLISTDLMKTRKELKIPGILSQIIEKTQAELFLGGYDIKPSNGLVDYQNQYNSAFHFGSDQKLKDVYRKMRLIPFGEGLPFGPLNKILSQYITNVSYFAEGERFTQFQTKSNISFVSAICYEILFSDFIREFLNKNINNPAFLINLTNDSWYGNTAEPSQHLFLAKWRALEFNLPIIRSTNTGITTVLMPDGSESARLTFQERKNLDIQIELKERKPTIFQHFGIFPLIFLALLFLAIEAYFSHKN